MNVQLVNGSSRITLTPDNVDDERFLVFLTTITLDGGQIICRTRPDENGECEQLTYDITKPAGRMK